MTRPRASHGSPGLGCCSPVSAHEARREDAEAKGKRSQRERERTMRCEGSTVGRQQPQQNTKREGVHAQPPERGTAGTDSDSRGHPTGVGVKRLSVCGGRRRRGEVPLDYLAP